MMHGCGEDATARAMLPMLTSSRASLPSSRRHDVTPRATVEHMHAADGILLVGDGGPPPSRWHSL